MLKKLLLPFLSLTLVLSSCFTDEVEENLVISGLRPVYGQPGTLKKISIQDPVPFEIPGRIVYLHPLLFINELNKGFHIIDNSIPANPKQIAFVSIPFNKDIAVKGSIIYANNDLDLVSLKYFSKDSIQLISRINNAFDGIPFMPDDYSGYFECMDPSKGDVIGWENATLTNPKCRK
ncbi:MAG TPA: hypothetical protein PLU49_15385 [Saprospiraceae bacterium]|nr:hypothetical protein [Saprospirales bacterium]HRQ31463.1 hypothetical protein [Saprospiraceae bacterium]